MNKKYEQLIKKKEEIEKQIKVFEELEKQKDFKTIKFKGKEFRIYKWENKPFGDFLKQMPKGFKLAEFNQFVELFDNKLIDYPKDWEFYWTKHFSKIKQKENFLSRFYLYRNGFLGANDGDLVYSNDNGRVVFVK